MSSDSRANPSKKIRRRPLYEFSSLYWQTKDSVEATTVSDAVHVAVQEEASTVPDLPPISDNPICTTCGQTFSTFMLQRAHFKTDVHKYNAKRKVRGRHPITEDQFEELDDLGSVESLSGSDSGSDAEATPSAGVTHGKLAERLEFRNPSDQDTFVTVYKSALPDMSSLQSLSDRGSWAVVMAGGGHFVAALWDVDGVLQRHKTFHRYTSRRKQGGSQAAADEARGNANRIRSAGATLRRYGEQALQTEVHGLLKSWYSSLVEAQCIYVRASQREKRDLLWGWHGSPLKKAQENGTLRNIPFPTRRATLKEATRVYEELSSVTISSISLASSGEKKQKETSVKAKTESQPAKATPAASKSNVRGTDHLKKRDENEKRPKKPQTATVDEPPPALNEEKASILKLCMMDSREQLRALLAERPEMKTVEFESFYFSDDPRFGRLEAAVGLVGVAAVCGLTDLVVWLMDNNVSPLTGTSPYLATKSKAVRTTLRSYWGKNPDRYEYADAGIPAPLSDTELRAAAERERAKRKKDREKKKEKARERIEAAKPPEQRARELRAMAAEARLLGNRCAGCRKSLEGITPFERLAYKYCSTQCVSKHRQELSGQ